MKVQIILTEGASGFVTGEAVSWKWHGGFLRVYAGRTLYFESPKDKVLAVSLTEN